MFEYIATLIGLHTADTFIANAQAEERIKTVVPVVKLCSPPSGKLEEQHAYIRRCLEQKDKDSKDTHPEMLDPNWIKKP